MFKSEYDQMIRENFDLSDTTTRRYIVTLEDAGQEQLLNALSSALYDKIVTKVDDIDFGTIPMSRGDITKVEGFAGTEECLAIIRRLVLEYKQSTAVVDVVLSAIQNVKDRKALFIKAYALNVELPMLLYNTVVLAIERSTSLMIATCMEYIKDPNSSSPKAALNKVAYQRTMDDVLFKQLISFNNMCANDSIDKAMDAVMKHPVKEDVEFQYGTMTPIVEEDPNADDAIENPVDSGITPDNTVEPFGNDPEVPVADDEPEEYEFPTQNDEDDNDITGDTDIPDDECGDACVGSDCAPDAPVEEDDDIDPDMNIQPGAPDSPEDDGVDADNIPAVVPGEDISSTDTPISEEDVPADSAEQLPVSQDKEEPVEEDVKQAFAIGGAVVGGTLAAIGLIKLAPMIANAVVGMLRNLVYGFFYTNLKFSDYLEVQADLLEANANDLKYSSNSTLSDEEKNKTVKKQLKWVAKLRKWSNMFALDTKQTNNKTNKEVEADKKHKKTVKKDEYNDYSIF